MASLVLSGTLGGVSAQADTWSSLQGAQAKDSAVVKKPATSSSSQLLFTEIEVLKQEIQALQAKVEEQSHELRKIKKEQKETFPEISVALNDTKEGAPPGTAVPAAGTCNIVGLLSQLSTTTSELA